jgi:hypothetical protein
VDAGFVVGMSGYAKKFEHRVCSALQQSTTGFQKQIPRCARDDKNKGTNCTAEAVPLQNPQE